MKPFFGDECQLPVVGLFVVFQLGDEFRFVLVHEPTLQIDELSAGCVPLSLGERGFYHWGFDVGFRAAHLLVYFMNCVVKVVRTYKVFLVTFQLVCNGGTFAEDLKRRDELLVCFYDGFFVAFFFRQDEVRFFCLSFQKLRVFATAFSKPPEFVLKVAYGLSQRQSLFHTFIVMPE